MEQKINNVSFLEIKPKSEIKNIIFLFHGYAQRASHMMNIFGKKIHKDFPNSLIISVNGLHECREHPGKRRFDWLRYDGRKWDLDAMRLAAAAAFKEIQNFIDSIIKQYALDYKDIMLVGFSQGARIALHSGFRLKKCCAGVLAYSGALSFPEVLSKEARVLPRALLVHGEKDPVLLVDESIFAAAKLSECGVDAKLHVVEGLDHTINDEAVNIGKGFIKECLGYI